ncbi:proton extrusion protein PcxA [Leptolyngbya valderiana BDU 20041]|nr:proton extrusion protein PcxA [Leptolyngbya valderiana BDU 20041]PPT07314.1 Membrane protein PxcA involved in light-induced proton extrusion [Geitlerinema sp. FC II]
MLSRLLARWYFLSFDFCFERHDTTRFFIDSQDMKGQGSQGIPGVLRAVRRWYFKTPERALDAAYRAALKIRSIENDYFDGKSISLSSERYSRLELNQFQSELSHYLSTIERRLAEFRASRSTLNFITQQTDRANINLEPIDETKSRYSPDEKYQFSETLKKLKIIDEVIAKYRREANSEALKNRNVTAKSSSPKTTVAVRSQTRKTAIETNGKNGKAAPTRDWRDRLSEPQEPRVETASDVESMAGKASLLPRSILRTIDRIKRELDPNAEEEVVEKFRYYKSKTVISLKFMLLLVLIPLLTHQISKNFVIRPIYNEFFNQNVDVFINQDFEEEAFIDLQRYEERLRFRMAIGQIPKLGPEEMEEQIEEKAHEIAEEYQALSNNAVQNVFADLCSLGAFCAVVITSKRELAIVKSFIDDLIYGLSDSAKAFIIILFTDIFVGYHSPHGWEVILESISRHFGLPESRDFNFLFIATFPVILDTVMKYWIFRYLNRISPSAVATYRNMNE